jgi:outer membrane protein OmpA-like peptidoglycan-associated protein
MKRLLALLLVSSAMGQTPIQNATVNDLVEKLAPEQPKTRSLGSRNLQPKPKSIDLVIQFDLDSAKLKEPGKPLLDNLVAAMQSDRLMNIKFKVEGHTDAQGSQEHNLKLSQSRADSVIAYMSGQGIDKERLAGEGKGFTELLLPDKPKAAENRRVRITTQP